MADPVTAWAATGAAGSIIQLVVFAAKLVKETNELMKSPNNALKSNVLVEKFTLMHSNLADQIADSENTNRPLSRTGQAVADLARECKDASSDLLKELDEMRVPDGLSIPGRAWQSARKARMALAKQKTIVQQKQHLSELTGQLSTAVLLDLRSNQISGLKDIYNRVGEAEARNASLIVESRDAILKAPKRTHDEASNVVDSLWFPEMQSRRIAIPDAYNKTLSWLFTERSPFPSWLTNSSDVFWVAGKAGSGKSTAMKFIANHHSTEALLSKWAGQSKVIIAQSYMWHPGFAMQRNEEGVLQELLFQILTSDRRLVDLISPQSKRKARSLKKSDPWSKKELMQAFNSIFEQTRSCTRYCLFVDGLDECAGEHALLIATLMELLKYSNVKICVSSRPWNVFRNAFEHLDAKIYIHDLTRGDINAYVNGMLGSLLQDDVFAAEVISGIVEKAQGVFLWVFLVVRSLREGFEEGDSVHDMRQRLDELPADLEEYFKHILDRISRNYRQNTLKALNLAARILNNAGWRWVPGVWGSYSFLSFWLLSQGYLDKTDFAHKYQPHHVTAIQVRDMSEKTTRYLNACCKDFLQFSSYPSDLASSDDRSCSLSYGGTVDYLHRTVYDFLHSLEMKPLLEEGLPGHFNHADFPIYVTLVKSKVKGHHDGHFCAPCARDICATVAAFPEMELQMMVEFEKLALDLLNYSCQEDCCSHLACPEDLDMICVTFATYNLYAFILRVFQLLPGCIFNMEKDGNRKILSLGVSLRQPYSTSHAGTRYICSGMRPNEYRQLHLIVLNMTLGEQALSEAKLWAERDFEHSLMVVRALIYHDLNVGVMSAGIAKEVPVSARQLWKYLPYLVRFEHQDEAVRWSRPGIMNLHFRVTDETKQALRTRYCGW